MCVATFVRLRLSFILNTIMRNNARKTLTKNMLKTGCLRTLHAPRTTAWPCTWMRPVHASPAHSEHRISPHTRHSVG